MENPKHRHAVFAGLVYSEAGDLAETTVIGDEPHYVILDGDFRRHILAEDVDRQVVELIQGQASASKEVVSEQIMGLLGKDDLFTKAMIDASIANMDQQVLEQGLPEDARTMLGMMGFKVIINVHGELVDVEMPGQAFPGYDE
ncbi:MAG TPA: hypothetical protein VGD99_07835 [Anaerolineae bacterium]